MKVVALLDTEKDTTTITCSFDHEEGKRIGEHGELELRAVAEQRMQSALDHLKTKHRKLSGRRKNNGKRGVVQMPEVFEAVKEVLEKANYPLSVNQVRGVLSLRYANQPTYNTIRRYLTRLVEDGYAAVEREGGGYRFRKRE